MRIRLMGILMIVLIAIPSLAQDEAVITGEAFVNSITIDDSAGITITIIGDLADACTELGEITQSLEDDTIFVTVSTTRPADAFCATVLVSFETSYELDISEIPAGEYTLNVNGITETITIVPLSCPEADEETLLFDDLGMCFVYPVDFEEISGDDFVLISQPLTSNAVLLIDVADAEDVTLDDLREQFEADEHIVEDIVIGGEDALIIETDDTREAYVIAKEQLYTFFLQAFDDEDDIAETLWSTVTESLFFPEPEEE